MNNQPSFFNKLPAGLQVTLLLAFSFTCYSIFIPLGFILVKPLYGINGADILLRQMMDNPDSLKNDMNKINALKLMQIIPGIGVFLLPAILFAYLKKPYGSYFQMSRFSKPLMYVLAILIFISINPLIDLTSSLNHLLHFSGALFETIKKLEDSAAKETNVLLVMPGFGDFIYNLILMAIVPAIVEEFFFRGCIQQTIYERSKNIHVSVWITAFIFSFMHFEFFGFVPRMLLGAMLGYLFYYSGSIWVNILAHAFNNGSQVVAVYLFQQKIISTNIADDNSTPTLYLLISLPILAALFYFLYKQRVTYPVTVEENTLSNEPPTI